MNKDMDNNWVANMIGNDYEFSNVTSNNCNYITDASTRQGSHIISNPIITRQGYCDNSHIMSTKKSIIVSPKTNQVEYTTILLNDPVKKITYFRNKKGNMFPFMNGIVQSAEILTFDALYDEIPHYIFSVTTMYNEYKTVELNETQFKNSEEIINQFQLQSHIYFESNESDKCSGELLRRHLTILLYNAKEVHLEYYKNPILDVKNSLNKGIQQLNEYTTKHLTKLHDSPITAVKAFFNSLLMLQDVTHRVLYVSWPITTLLRSNLGEYDEILNPLVIEGNSLKRTFISQRFLNIYTTQNDIVSLDDINRIKDALIKTQNECVLINDGVLKRSYKKTEIRNENINTLLDMNQRATTITKELKSSQSAFSKDLNASIIILSNYIRYEDISCSSLVGFELNDDDIDEDIYYNLTSDKYITSNFYSHFITFCAANYDDMERYLKDVFLNNILKSKFLQPDKRFTYSALLSGLGWLSKFVVSTGLDIKDYLGNYEDYLKLFFLENESHNISGYSLLFQNIILKMHNDGSAIKVPLDEISSASHNNLHIYYDNDYIYFIEKELNSRISSHLPNHIKLKYILSDLKNKGYLVTYNSSPYYTIKITSPDGSGIRRTMIQIKSLFLENEISGLI